MQIKLDITGIKELQAGLKDFSERRMNAVLATALTRTAKSVQGQWQGQINQRIDRPVLRTQNAVGFTGANAQKLEANVFLKDRLAGTNPATYLRPQESGGSRLLKKFEQSLVRSGAMPSGYVTVPGKNATLDGNGNVSRGQLIAVISALGSGYSPGYARTISKVTAKRLASQARHGRQYIAVSPAESKRYKVSPGIYERMPNGDRKAVFLFKRSVSYKKRLSLVDRAAIASIEKEFQAQASRALVESLARLQALGAGQ